MFPDNPPSFFPRLPESPPSEIAGDTSSSEDLPPRRTGGGRVKEEECVKVKTELVGVAQSCISFTCPGWCPYGGRCAPLARDITVVSATRTQLFGTPEAKKPSQVRRRFVFNMLDDHKVVDVGPPEMIRWRLFIEHQEVCMRAFVAITGVSEPMIKRAKHRISVERKKHFQDRVPFGIKHGGSVRNMSKDGGAAMAWLKGVADRLGQHMPNANETVLPFNERRIVHEYYVVEVRLRGGVQKPLNYSAFTELWRNDPVGKTIKLARKKGDFAQCNSCAEFAVELTKAETNVVVEDVRRRWDVHVDQVMRCRTIYYDHRDYAFARPDKCLCIIADIMDQAKTTLPHFVRTPKFMSSMFMLKQCVMGVKVHGHRTFHYIGLPRVSPGGSNFMLECLLRTLRKVASAYEDGFLPPKLYLQLDNCSGDNKNFAVLGETFLSKFATP